VLSQQQLVFTLFRKRIILKKLRKAAMINFNDFLIFAAIVALLSIVVGVILGYHAEKQLKEFKTRTGKK
jgi:hypothetical protein